MSNQTLQRSATKRRSRTKTASAAPTYRRQTARLEGRRDGKPLIFGWGSHLTRAQKTRIQQRTLFAFCGVVLVAIIFVFAFGVLQQNVLIPNATMASVNSVNISQDTYRKQLAYDSQALWNTIQSELKQQAALKGPVSQGDKKAIQQATLLTQKIQTDEANYAQAQLTQNALDSLVNDQLVQQGAQRFEQQNHAAASLFTPSASAVNTTLASFKKSFPAGESYGTFLQKDNLSTNDVTAAITVHLRSYMMQQYLTKQLVSPTRQVHLRRIETNNAAAAQKVLQQIKKNSSDANWSTLAKQDSLDPDTKNVGGDMGWVAPGTGDAAIENWAYATGRKAGNISGVIKDSSGTFDVVQVVAIDPSRAVDPSTLQAAQSNALAHWLARQRADASNHFGTTDQTMLNAPRNLPVTPNLNASLPNENPAATSGQTGLPSSGLPSSGLPSSGGATP